MLHSKHQVLSGKHLLSWGLLTLSAGAVNAGAFLACGRYVTHVTGTVTNIGLDAAVWDLMLDYALVLSSFIVGAMLSVVPLQGRMHQSRRTIPSLPLFGVIVVLCGVSLAGHLGAFGAIGSPVEEAEDFALLCLLAFAMGLLNACVASCTGNLVRTTHMTGPASDLGVSLMTAWYATGDERADLLRMAALRAQKVASFCVGAALMVPCVEAFDYGAFLMPAVLVLTATLRSFVASDTRSRLQQWRAHLPGASKA